MNPECALTGRPGLYNWDTSVWTPSVLLQDGQAYIYIYIYIYAFSRRFYPKRLTLTYTFNWLTHSSDSFYILSALAFPGNRTHDLGIANAMLYQLSYRKAVAYTDTYTDMNPECALTGRPGLYNWDTSVWTPSVLLQDIQAYITETHLYEHRVCSYRTARLI